MHAKNRVGDGWRIRHAPSIRDHQDIAPHLDEEYSCQRNSVAVIPSVAVEHHYCWTGRRKLVSVW